MPRVLPFKSKVAAVLRAEALDNAHVRVILSGSGSCFGLEAGEGVRIASAVGWEELESDEARKANVFGLLDHAHAAATESFEDAVVRDSLADQGCKAAVRRRCKVVSELQITGCDSGWVLGSRRLVG